MGALSPVHLLLLAIIGIVIFGRRLPEMGRYLGKGIVEFKKGMHGLEDEIEGTTAARPETPVQQIRAPQRVTPATPPQA